ncbi:pentapeptide repeat-containing protein [Nostoc linckia]|uniref:pentapeptide repeat-containing protein n=1 Tax=Nostoc linckia TaxID=92942 RepID=UPI000BFF89D8|nr:pentapeptide repeat-containing protein [Nostoc linckia]
MGRSCQASKQGVEKAKAAIKVKGWTQEYLAGAAGCSRPIVNKFFARRPVEMRLFQTICTELSLEWDEIAELESESEQLNGADKDKIIQEPSGTTQVLTDKKSYAFAIAGTVSPEDIAKLKAIIALIQKVSQDSSITIVDIERGSIKLILEGSQEGLERLENLFRSGQLEDVLGISVENVEFITLPNSTSDKNRLAFTIAGDVAESEIAILKAALIETSDDTVKRSQSQRLAFRGNPLRVNLIFKNLIRGNLGDVFRILKNLIRADLRGADLSGVNLSGVNLSGADLGDANLFAANLRDADLSAANLGDANLSLAKLGGANLSLANLSCAKLAGADLSNADLSDADLSDADLLDVKFGNAKLSIAMLGANLTRTNLSRANLSRANLCGAILTDAILESTIVINALFDGSIGLTEDMKRDLERRGAIFGDRPPVLSSK